MAPKMHECLCDPVTLTTDLLLSSICGVKGTEEKVGQKGKLLKELDVGSFIKSGIKLERTIADEHSIKFIENGRLVICRWSCEFLRDGYSRGLALSENQQIRVIIRSSYEIGQR